jgi:alkaline phosphatase
MHRFVLCAALLLIISSTAVAEDYVRTLQTEAVRSGKAEWGNWGPYGLKYSEWLSHSNRLIPAYTFGMKLDDVARENSVYRDTERLTALYGYLPRGTLNESAEYFDQTDIYRLQKLAAERGKKRIILFVFDGMDWWTTYAAAIYECGKVAYTDGRGAGLYFQDYRGTLTDFGYMVTSPYIETVKVDVNTQQVRGLSGLRGGYDWKLAGTTPWSIAVDRRYPIAKSDRRRHAYTDSASSATSMTAGIKTYNDSVNIDPYGRQAETIAHKLQAQGWAIGVVTSVPISHATPACTYSHNVHRDDYQDLTRDLIGLPSASHANAPLSGVDVLIGAGWGVREKTDSAQGKNFVRGNKYLTVDDLKAIDADNGGRYVVVQRTAGTSGAKALAAAADEAVKRGLRLFGYFGATSGHLPFRTADGHYDPTISVKNDDKAGPIPAERETYSPADLEENPTLADMATAALDVLSKRAESYWLLIEAGDVDWANHANNIDNSIGAVISGDNAFRATVEWIEKHGGWDETALFLTADHGHYLMLDQPGRLVPSTVTTP